MSVTNRANKTKAIKTKRWAGRLASSALLLGLFVGVSGHAQSAAPVGGQGGATRQVGTVKTTTDHDFVVTDSAGQDHAVEVPAGARVLLIPPGSKDLSSATAGTAADVQPGDRVIVTGKPGGSGPALTAARVLVMKSGAIAQTNAASQAAWTKGVGGVVKSVDAAANTVMVASGGKDITVKTTPATILRRYSGASVRFEDATRSTLADLKAGDHLRARGTRSPDGSAFAADEVVTGSFHDYAGQISSIDASAQTLTLKDLATKKVVTISFTPQSNLRRMPPEAATRFAARERAGGAQGSAAGRPSSATSASPEARSGGATSSRPEAGPGRRPGGPEAAGSQAGAGSPAGAAGRTAPDLSTLISRLPTETLGGLKPGEAVMIVASSSAGNEVNPTAITLLAGVEPILAAAPAGEAFTLSPWSVDGGGEGEAGAAAGPQ